MLSIILYIQTILYVIKVSEKKGGIIIIKIATKKIKKVFCLFLTVSFISGGINIVLSEKNDLINNVQTKPYYGFDEKVDSIEEYSTSSNQRIEKNQLSSISDILSNDSSSDILSSTVTIKGVIKDNVTGQIIENAHIFVIDSSIFVSYLINEVYSDSNGYYELNIGYMNSLIVVRAKNYFSKFVSFDYHENENLYWYNFSLNPNKPHENSKITVELYDKDTNARIDQGIVLQYWTDNQGHIDYNYTYGDSDGTYQLDICSGTIGFILISQHYFYEYTDSYTINENEDKTFVYYLNHIPPETSKIVGTITEDTMKNPIENALIQVYWSNSEHKMYQNFTYSDENGNYSLKIAAGTIQMIVSKENYFDTHYIYFEINESETVKRDFSLHPFPEENAVVKGYIRNEVTDELIVGAIVEIDWYDSEGYYLSNVTHSDSNGFYSFNVAEGTVDLLLYGERFYHKYVDEFDIAANQVVNMDFYLAPFPEENSIISGFVKDRNSDDALEDVEISIVWNDSLGHSDSNYTFTDSTGFYHIHVPQGTIRMDAEKTGYYNEEIDKFTIDEYESKQIDISLYPKKDEVSVISGFITDFSTGNPISGASIHLNWNDEYGHYDSNYTETDSNGFYEFNVAPGSVELFVYARGYYSKSTDEFFVSEFETIDQNIDLFPMPAETGIVRGYVRDANTNDPIAEAAVHLSWNDGSGHYDSNYTETDSNGFYEFNVAPGIIEIRVTAEDYFYEFTDDFFVSEFETVDQNFFLISEPSENAVVKGYVRDVYTNDPIAGVSVKVYWYNEDDKSYSNTTETNTDGYYEIDVATGMNYLRYSADDYFREYSDHFFVSESETRNMDFSLTPKPEQNSKVTGIIRDENTKNPLENVLVYLNWNDSKYHYDSNNTYTDANGSYSFNVATGTIRLSTEKEGYLRNNTYSIAIQQDSIYHKDLTLFKKPDEYSIISGYVYIQDTGDPLYDANINVRWEDEHGHYYSNYTTTDSTGFYKIYVASGFVDINIYKSGFYSNYYENIPITDYHHLWFNKSLTFSPFNLEITKPENGLYYKNNQIIPLLFQTIIIGDIEIKVDVTSRAEKVEFYIDGRLKKSDTTYPYFYRWNEKSVLLHRHILEVKALDAFGNWELIQTRVTKYF